MLLIATLADSRELLAPLLELLETRDWDLLCCPDPSTALDQLQRDLPDLIIIDNCLSGSAPGMRLLRRLRSDRQTRDIPIVMVLDSADDVADWRGIESPGVTGTCDVLDWDDLVRTIEHATAASHHKDGSRVAQGRI